MTRDALRWGERRGRWRRIDRQVYAEGADEPDQLDAARARVLAAGGIASGRLAALLYELDGGPLRQELRTAHLIAPRSLRIAHVVELRSTP